MNKQNNNMEEEDVFPMKKKKYDEHMRLLNQAYSMFAHTNPLHADRFPAVKVLNSRVECILCLASIGFVNSR